MMLAVVALVACGDDGAPGGNGGGAQGGSNQGGETSGPGGNGSGGDPQGGEAQGGSPQGGMADGGAPQGGAPQGGSAEGGQGGGSGANIAELCQTACGYIAGCANVDGGVGDCVTECSADLADCDATQLDEVDGCNQAAMNDCKNFNAFEACLEAVACINP